MADMTAGADTPPADTTVAPTLLYSVHCTQDGSQVRAELTYDDAVAECADLNAQAKQQIGMTAGTYDPDGFMVTPPSPIFAGMVNGEVSRFEVRSASGLVI